MLKWGLRKKEWNEKWDYTYIGNKGKSNTLKQNGPTFIFKNTSLHIVFLPLPESMGVETVINNFSVAGT